MTETAKERDDLEQQIAAHGVEADHLRQQLNDTYFGTTRCIRPASPTSPASPTACQLVKQLEAAKAHNQEIKAHLRATCEKLEEVVRAKSEDTQRLQMTLIQKEDEIHELRQRLASLRRGSNHEGELSFCEPPDESPSGNTTGEYGGPEDDADEINELQRFSSAPFSESSSDRP